LSHFFSWWRLAGALMCVAVGEKDGKLFLAGSAPVK
jgi:hypothetical protein